MPTNATDIRGPAGLTIHKRLTRAAKARIHWRVSRPDGRSRKCRKAAGEESPGSIDMRCRITSGGGDPRESATENEPLPPCEEVRVKRCGKSAPRIRQRRRHGKPHREQNRIGTATRSVRARAITPQGDVRLAVRVGCSRPCASMVPEEWPSRIVRKDGALQNPAYRPADASIDQKRFRRKRVLLRMKGSA